MKKKCHKNMKTPTYYDPYFAICINNTFDVYVDVCTFKITEKYMGYMNIYYLCLLKSLSKP